MTQMPMWIPWFWRSESEEDDLPLREFVYLDETAVVSLLASLTREVTEARTDRDTTESKKKTGIKAKLSFLPFISPGLTREKISVDRDTEEIVRRSEIESKFDELYSQTSSHLELQSKDTESRIPVSELTEGGVMEVEVEFSGHKLFHYYKAFQYLIDVAEGADYEFENQEKQIIELMGSLFGDEIPVVGKVLNYQLVDGDTIQDMEEADEGEDLWIAGTLDADMLRPEPSQVLFEDSKFTAYVRVPEPGIQDDWDPLKLTRVISSISDSIGDQLSQVIQAAFSQAQEEIDNTDLADGTHQANPQDHYDEYFDLIEEEADLDLSNDQKEQFLSSAATEVVQQPRQDEYEVEANLLKQITDLVEDEEDVKLDREMLGEERIRLLDQVSDEEIQNSMSLDRNYLEVSFVAVYW